MDAPPLPPLAIIMEIETMAASSYDRSLSLVLAHEGGFVNHPKDPGGATNRGVTQRVYDAWRRSREQQRRSVIHVTNEEIQAIYREQYWDIVRADELPPGLDYAVFDYAVNSGPVQAVTDLQRVLRVSVDGHMGVVTLAAASASGDRKAIIVKLLQRRFSFVRRLKTWSVFGRGWTRRIAGVREAAVAMAGATP